MNTCGIGVAVLLSAVLLPESVHAESSSQTGHRELRGVVVEKGGAPAVKVPDGTTYQLNENRARRHGHDLPRPGDEVTVVIDENNLVLDMHPVGTPSQHRFVTGELLSIGKLQREVTIQTADGPRVFPLEKTETPSSIRDGALVTAEINEAGSVIDLHPAARP